VIGQLKKNNILKYLDKFKLLCNLYRCHQEYYGYAPH